MRVSTEHQDTENQERAIAQFCEHHGYAASRYYDVSASAWNGGADGGEYKAAIQKCLDDAYRGEFKVLICWALDRLTRGGAEQTLKLIRQFRERGVLIVSIQEPWLGVSPETQDVLVAFIGWVAQQESARRSERMRAGLARRKAAGLPVGRMPGARDRTQRTRRFAKAPAGGGAA